MRREQHGAWVLRFDRTQGCFAASAPTPPASRGWAAERTAAARLSVKSLSTRTIQSQLFISPLFWRVATAAFPDPFPPSSGAPPRRASPDLFALPSPLAHNTGAAPPSPPCILACVAGVALFIYLSPLHTGPPSLFPAGGRECGCRAPLSPFSCPPCMRLPPSHRSTPVWSS